MARVGGLEKDIRINVRLVTKQFDKAVRRVRKQLNRLRVGGKRGGKAPRGGFGPAIGFLGSLFFLQGIASAMEDAFRPAAELAGLFEIWGLILTILFLPAMLMLLPIMLKLLKIVLNMSPELKLFVGLLILMLAALAIVGGSIISFVLAVAGLWIIAGVVGVFLMISTEAAFALGVLAVVLGVIVVAVVAAVIAFESLRARILALIELGNLLGPTTFEEYGRLGEAGMKDVASPGAEGGIINQLMNTWNIMNRGTDDNQKFETTEEANRIPM